MNTNNTAIVTPFKAATTGSLSAATGHKASGQPAVSFATHDAPSNAEPPASKKAPGTSASALKKRADKLGTHIVELIESQELEPIIPCISTLAMEMVAANAYVTNRVENAKQFDLTTAHTDDKWLPSNIKKIKIGLKASKLEGGEFYTQLDAEIKDHVEKFKDYLNTSYHRLAAKEEEYAKEQRLLTFTTHTFTLFQVYTKYYAEIDVLGTLSRPVDTSAAKFLSIFMEGYLMKNGFFGNASYLDVTLQVALDALTAHVPGMMDSVTPLTQANPISMTTGNEAMNEAAKKRDTFGYTVDEYKIYRTIEKEVTKYFLQVTKEVQENIDKLRHKTIKHAKLDAWLKAKKTDEAAAACAAAVATVSTITPDTMTALIEETTTAVSTRVAKKEAAKAVDKQLAKKFGQKNVPGGGKAKTTQPKKGTGKQTGGGPNSKPQPGKKRKRQYSVDRPGKSQKSADKQQTPKAPPTERPQPRPSKKKGRNGKGNRDGKRNDGGKGKHTRRK
jgi:hypothetical protein